MKNGWAIAFAILAVAPCSSSTVIVLWTPTGSVIGADAKIRSGDGKFAGVACKIGTSENILWAQTGILGTRESPDAIHNILADELNSSGTVDSKISKAESRISAVLFSFFNLPRIKPAVLSHPDEHQVQVVVIALENGITRMIVRSFIPKKGVSGSVEVCIVRDACPDLPNCGSSQYEALGFHDEADRIVKTDRSVWNRSPRAMVEYLIRTEIKFLPRDVGPPISIVSMDSTGIHWISKGACTNN